MPKLIVNIDYPWNIFAVDREGRHVEPSETVPETWRVTNALKLEEGELSFHVVVAVPLQLADSKPGRERIAVDWLAGPFADDLADRGYVNYFGRTDVRVDPNRALAPCGARTSVERDIDLAPAGAARALEAIDHLNKVGKGFGDLKEKISDLAGSTAFGFSQTLGEGRRVLHGLAQILSASADQGAPSAEDARRAAHAYEELAKRKVENNATYQSHLTDLRRFAWGLQFPRLWHQKPHAPGSA